MTVWTWLSYTVCIQRTLLNSLPQCPLSQHVFGNQTNNHQYKSNESIVCQSVRPVVETGRAHGRLEHFHHRHRHCLQVRLILEENITLKYNQFRKISRGRIWLDYKNWKDFLLELSAAKKLGLTDLISKLEMCGKPAINTTRRKKKLLSWWTNEDTRDKLASKQSQNHSKSKQLIDWAGSGKFLQHKTTPAWEIKVSKIQHPILLSSITKKDFINVT